MKVAIVHPPFTDDVGPAPLWERVASRVRELGVTAEVLDANVHLLAELASGDSLARLAAPIVGRFETLERKAHLSGDERRRHARLASIAPLVPAVCARVDAARVALGEASTYADVPTVVTHRTVWDLARHVLHEAVALDAYRNPGACAQPLDALAAALGPGLPPAPAADVLLLVLSHDTQVAAARALALAWRPRAAAFVCARLPEDPRVLELPALGLEGLDARALRHIASTAPAQDASPGAPGATSTDPPAAGWTSAVRLASEVLLRPDPRAADPPAGAVALARASGTDASTAVPVPLDGGPPRLLAVDAAQRAALGLRDPGAGRAVAGSEMLEHVLHPGAHAVIVRTRHDRARPGGVGVGRTAPEQIRGGLRRAVAPPAVVDLATGRRHVLGPDAAAAFALVDGRSTGREIAARLAGGDASARVRAVRALGELSEAGAIAR